MPLSGHSYKRNMKETSNFFTFAITYNADTYISYNVLSICLDHTTNSLQTDTLMYPELSVLTKYIV